MTSPCYCKHPKPNAEGICKVCKGTILLKPKKDTTKETNLIKKVEKLENQLKEKEEENLRLKKIIRTAESIGWKGRDKLVIEKVGENWELLQHRKDKSSGEIAIVPTKVPEVNVGILWELIQKHCPNIGTSTTYRKLVPSILEAHHLPLEIDAFNGGRNRKTYFMTYQYCAKVLEFLGWIKYGGRGTITRLV